MSEQTTIPALVALVDSINEVWGGPPWLLVMQYPRPHTLGGYVREPLGMAYCAVRLVDGAITDTISKTMELAEMERWLAELLAAERGSAQRANRSQ